MDQASYSQLPFTSTITSCAANMEQQLQQRLSRLTKIMDNRVQHPGRIQSLQCFRSQILLFLATRRGAYCRCPSASKKVPNHSGTTTAWSKTERRCRGEGCTPLPVVPRAVFQAPVHTTDKRYADNTKIASSTWGCVSLISLLYEARTLSYAQLRDLDAFFAVA